MNERNVNALALILRELNLGPEESDQGVPELEAEACRYCAELLAERGVLVPSAIAREDMFGLALSMHRQHGDPTELIAELEAIAKDTRAVPGSHA